MTMAARIIGTYSRVSRGSSLRLGRELPEVVDAGALHRALHAARPAVVGGERQVPVAVENPDRACCRYFAAATVAFSGSDRSSMYQSRRSPFSSAVPLMNCQTPLAFDARQGVGLERALDQRHVGEVERQPFRAEDVLNHRQVLAAALHAVFDEVVQPALEQLDVGQHPLVQRNRDVVAVGLQVGLRRLPSGSGAVGAGRERRRQRQQLVDRRRLVCSSR